MMSRMNTGKEKYQFELKKFGTLRRGKNLTKNEKKIHYIGIKISIESIRTKHHLGVVRCALLVVILES